MAGRRNPRVDEAVREAVAYLLEEEIGDPRVRFVTVTGVRVTEDFKEATIYYTSLDPDTLTATPGKQRGDRVAEQSEVADGLAAALPRVQRLLGRRVKLRNTPVISFVEDPVKEQVSTVDRLLREMHEREGR